MQWALVPGLKSWKLGEKITQSYWLNHQATQSQAENCDNLEDWDFVLVLQTLHQKDKLKTFAPARVVCVDGTHGTSGYDFLHISVLVINEFGEGFPVAWCLSNRQDQFLLIPQQTKRQSWRHCASLVYVWWRRTVLHCLDCCLRAWS